jgi:hypothetical protein
METHPYRPRSTTLTNAISSTGTTGLVVGDASFLMNHDILQLIDSATGNSEYVQLSVDPTSGTGITVTRGVSGTSALSSVTAASTINVISNSRTGQEYNQSGLDSIGTPRWQYCQTHMFPVQVGGSAQTTRAAVMPGGIQSPFDFMRTMQLQAMVDDVETNAYYGIAQAPVDATPVTSKANGLKAILTTNNVTAPVNAAAYASTDMIRDGLQAAQSNGGSPDLLIVASNFMSGFATWGQALMRIPAGETKFGTPIDLFEAPFLNGVTVIQAPLLRAGTFITLTSSEVYMRFKRLPFWNQHGIRGDLVEGDWITECAIEVVNDSHHAWVEGITGFSAN